MGDCRSENEGRETVHYISRKVLPNAYLNEYLVDEAESFVGKVVGIMDTELKIVDFGFERLMHRRAWGFILKYLSSNGITSLARSNMDLVILTGMLAAVKP